MRWFILLMLLPVMLQGQGYTITGRVVDSLTNAPLIGANVVLRYHVPGSDLAMTTGTTSDLNGDFFIQFSDAPPPVPEQLQISYLGYHHKTVILKPDWEQNLQELESIRMSSGGKVYMHDDEPHIIVHPPLIDKRQTNSRSRVTQEEIENFPGK